MPRIGVCLSGCGVMDGSEIHEAVLTLLAVDRAGAEAVCMAPDMDQARVWDHYRKTESTEKRNVLVESARIARGNIRNLKDVKAADIDALVFPGGFGAALNLSDFAAKGADATVHPEVGRILREMAAAKKPIGAICIAPATVAKGLADAGVQGVRITIGSDPGTAAQIERTGQKHVACAASAISFDEGANVASTPAYMLAKSIGEAAEGIERLVGRVVEAAARRAAAERVRA